MELADFNAKTQEIISKLGDNADQGAVTNLLAELTTGFSEEVAAKAFGFPEFRRLTDVDLKLEENEKNTYEDFGYWCRQIPMS